MTDVDDKVRLTLAPLIDNGELLMSAVIILDVCTTDGDSTDRWVRLKGTDGPWWSTMGLIEAGRIIMLEESTDD